MRQGYCWPVQVSIFFCYKEIGVFNKVFYEEALRGRVILTFYTPILTKMYLCAAPFKVILNKTELEIRHRKNLAKLKKVSSDNKQKQAKG